MSDDAVGTWLRCSPPCAPKPWLYPMDQEPASGSGSHPAGLASLETLGPYRDFFDPRDLHDDPVTFTVATDVAEVHADLLRGLAIYDGNTPDDVRDAVWEWRFAFYSHWGEHATGALRVLYWHLRD